MLFSITRKRVTRVERHGKALEMNLSSCRNDQFQNRRRIFWCLNDLSEPVLIANTHLPTISIAISLTTFAENQHVRNNCVWNLRRIHKGGKNCVSRERIEINLKSGRRIEQILKLSLKSAILLICKQLIITSLQSGVNCRKKKEDNRVSLYRNHALTELSCVETLARFQRK